MSINFYFKYALNFDNMKERKLKQRQTVPASKKNVTRSAYANADTTFRIVLRPATTSVQSRLHETKQSQAACRILQQEQIKQEELSLISL